MSWLGNRFPVSGTQWAACKKLLVLLFTIHCTLYTAACGFTPLYADKGADDATSAPAKFNTVAIGNIPDQEGQALRNTLMDQLYTSGEPASPQYRLNVAPIVESKTDLVVTKTSSTTRAQLRLTTTMILTDAATGKTLLTRPLAAVDSYNILDSQFTTRVSEQSARQNCLDTLARLIEAQLALYFKRSP